MEAAVSLGPDFASGTFVVVNALPSRHLTAGSAARIGRMAEPIRGA
jgi:hypothetical protein